MQRHQRRLSSGALFVLGCLLVCAAMANAQQDTREPEAKNMERVGFNDLQNRSAYQPVINKQGDRWYAYVGHLGGEAPNPLTGKVEPNGTSILDVTDPAHPTYVAHIPGEPSPAGAAGEAGGAQMVRVCNGSDLPRADKTKVYMLRAYGNSAHELWDVTNPAKPNRMSVVVSGLHGTHKTWWECDGGIAYLVGGKTGWRTPRMAMIYDLGDPAHPTFIRDFGLPGQQPGSTGPLATDLHGPISTGPKGNRVYFGYGTSANGVLQIVDRQKLLTGPSEPTEANLLYPQVSRLDFPPDVGAHTVFPVLGVILPEFAKNANHAQLHDYIVTVGETIRNECTETRQIVHIVDITTETRPLGVASWTANEAPDGFCGRGGRFGTHSSNESFSPIYYKKIMFIASFNAGVRALDIRDPTQPKEVAFYVPGITDKTDKRCVGTGAEQHCKVAIQTNNVEVDERGFIYIVDRANTGMHILRLSGDARRIVNLPD